MELSHCQIGRHQVLLLVDIWNIRTICFLTNYRYPIWILCSNSLCFWLALVWWLKKKEQMIDVNHRTDGEMSIPGRAIIDSTIVLTTELGDRRNLLQFACSWHEYTNWKSVARRRWCLLPSYRSRFTLYPHEHETCTLRYMLWQHLEHSLSTVALTQRMFFFEWFACHIQRMKMLRLIVGKIWWY